MRFRTFTSTAILLTAAAAAIVAQPQQRRATTITAIRAYPGFYHQQTVLVVGEIKGTLERATIGTEEGTLTLVAREVKEGRVEARGQLLDIGRVAQDDPRLIPFNLLERIRAAYQDRWPKPGEELILLLGSTGPAPVATDVTGPPFARWRWSRRNTTGKRSRSSGSSAAAISSETCPKRRRKIVLNSCCDRPTLPCG